MIARSRDFDLGHDKTRMKDERDAARQSKTVDVILERFFHTDPDRRAEIQVLADEVGMGKTFVALGVAYSVLRAMSGHGQDDLQHCYRQVLVITPDNDALFEKWQQEVGEFVKRCVTRGGYEAASWFASVPVRRPDELAAALRARSGGPSIIVAKMGLFRCRMVHGDLKCRYLLGLLFRSWSRRFGPDQRRRLLAAAPASWPRDPNELTRLTEWERGQVPFGEADVLSALSRVQEEGALAESPDGVGIALSLCREIAQPYKRNREELFSALIGRLNTLYKAVALELIGRDFPLVIVDEAHNWKNGPLHGANGYADFMRHIAGRARRALLLTATPFQLHPDEMLEILKISDGLKPSTRVRSAEQRRECLRELRETTIRPVLGNSAATSRRFARAWARLPAHVVREDIVAVWNTAALSDARTKLARMARDKGEVDASALSRLLDSTTDSLDPDLRPFVHEALRLFAYNEDLSHELGALVIRHRRSTEHRLFKIGAEYDQPSDLVAKRPDRHLLHQAPGLDVRGTAELPHYLLMRCVTETKKAKGRGGRSSLGSALTGCYSTLLKSSEGREVRYWLKNRPQARIYLDLLMDMVSETEDEHHPKVSRVVDAVLDNWRRGEKSLLFCFRVNTAERLRAIIDGRIREEIEARAASCLGGPKKLENLRRRLTSREQDLITIGLDRVLWSLLWTWSPEDGLPPFAPGDLYLCQQDMEPLARLSLRYGVQVSGERVDRVFLTRATEHVIASRLQRLPALPAKWRAVMSAVASPDWVSHPYRLHSQGEDDEAGPDRHNFDERGVHRAYEAGPEPPDTKVQELARALAETRERARRSAQIPLLDAYAEGPNLWLGEVPAESLQGSGGTVLASADTRSLHQHLWSLSYDAENEIDWESRRKSLLAMRKAVLRQSVLLRLLPGRSELEEGSWGKLLVESFYAPLPGQGESMASRMRVFLEDLDAASGSLSRQEGKRYAIYSCTRLSDQQFVALVSGTSGGNSLGLRARIFEGFNTPLLPEILVCTQVGQEGIDLHRHCRNVVHFDLAWNPAVLEQRTGRADRIGSQTFRERALGAGSAGPFLEIGVPFLAGTYDERMYEELRLRAQVFEVLTGGDFTADNAEASDGDDATEGDERQMGLLPLPDVLVNDLRVKLNVWK